MKWRVAVSRLVTEPAVSLADLKPRQSLDKVRMCSSCNRSFAERDVLELPDTLASALDLLP